MCLLLRRIIGETNFSYNSGAVEKEKLQFISDPWTELSALEMYPCSGKQVS